MKIFTLAEAEARPEAEFNDFKFFHRDLLYSSHSNNMAQIV